MLLLLLRNRYRPGLAALGDILTFGAANVAAGSMCPSPGPEHDEAGRPIPRPSQSAENKYWPIPDPHP